MAITSTSQLIDIATISSGCATIRAAAADYTKCANHIQEASEICTPEALSVDNKSMQPSLEELALAVSTIESNVDYFCSQVESVASQIYAKQYAELEQYWAEQEALRKKAEEEAAKANS